MNHEHAGSASSVEEAGTEPTAVPGRSKSRLSLSDISPSRSSFLPRFLRSSFSRLLHREKERGATLDYWYIQYTQ